MCGRYSLFSKVDSEELRQILERAEKQAGEALKDGEIFPTDLVPVLVERQGRMQVLAMKWGFPGRGGKGLVINARAETLLERPMFREVAVTRRCIVPTTGFYEWDKSKNKYLFTLPGEEMLYLAGLYDLAPVGDGSGELRFVVITTEPNAWMKEIHDRMPVVLRREERRDWLLPGGNWQALLDRSAVELEKRIV